MMEYDGILQKGRANAPENRQKSQPENAQNEEMMVGV